MADRKDSTITSRSAVQCDGSAETMAWFISSSKPQYWASVYWPRRRDGNPMVRPCYG
ncbi:hypothetical protein BH10PSE17_BH10PSE17_21020 [soil metagenome]